MLGTPIITVWMDGLSQSSDSLKPYMKTRLHRQTNICGMAGQWACIMPDMPDTEQPVTPVSVDPNRLKITNNDASGGTLVGFKCNECDTTVFGPAVFCQSCTSTDLEAVELGGKGILFSYTIVRIPPAGWPGDVPYVLGQVELPQGPQVLAEVIDCEHEDLKIGMAVEMVLKAVPAENGGPDKAVYKWRPA
ncbi:MAG: Zn-ribbon domain-containing OB-fold protein [SAR202 cluster bacterium]|nr:Zn-ribbon domain-containing OB-fold protein [SAR202 cluster bacterium]